MKEQLLDTMDLERERGITISRRRSRIAYTARDGQKYELNLIDTPGHVDFSYEVSRSLAACEGAILLVDAFQGVQAQTVANAYLAMENDLDDRAGAQQDRPARAATWTRPSSRCTSSPGRRTKRCSPSAAKTGEGVEAVLEAVVARVPPPEGDPDGASRALIFDSDYDQYRGVVVYVRVVDGAFAKRQMIRMLSSHRERRDRRARLLRPGDDADR